MSALEEAREAYETLLLEQVSAVWHGHATTSEDIAAANRAFEVLLAAYRASLSGGMERAAQAMVESRGLVWLDPTSPQAARLSMTYLSQHSYVALVEAAAPYLVVEEVERLQAKLAVAEARVRELEAVSCGYCRGLKGLKEIG